MVGDREGLWLAQHPGKRWTELFFLAYSPFWIVWALGIVVPFEIYEKCDEWGYMAIGLGASLPCFLLPPLLQPQSERQRPFWQRHWVKANVWIAIFSFIGNYFWTHYFYDLLGASYTFKSWRLNDVPITLYFMTHAYFCFYHTLSNLALRRLRHAFQTSSRLYRVSAMGLAVFLMAYTTAIMETLTIAHFPYYTFRDRQQMSKVQGLVDALREYIQAGRPFLGICLGLQLLFEGSEENGGVEGLGLIPGRCAALSSLPWPPSTPYWLNDLDQWKASSLLQSVGDRRAYFVHSYCATPTPANDDWVLATSHYGMDFVAAIRQGDVHATQFHPEKSGPVGLAIIDSFLNSDGSTKPEQVAAQVSSPAAPLGSLESPFKA
ncbi:hypothetical protein WJX84_012325, partial [Apatococcus fuscideae]